MIILIILQLIICIRTLRVEVGEKAYVRGCESIVVIVVFWGERDGNDKSTRFFMRLECN